MEKRNLEISILSENLHLDSAGTHTRPSSPDCCVIGRASHCLTGFIGPLTVLGVCTHSLLLLGVLFGKLCNISQEQQERMLSTQSHLPLGTLTKTAGWEQNTPKLTAPRPRTRDTWAQLHPVWLGRVQGLGGGGNDNNLQFSYSLPPLNH